MHFFRGLFSIGATAVLLSACADPEQNPTPEETPKQSLSSPADLDGNGKIIIYRGTGIPWGLPALMTPDIKMNGQPVGQCVYSSNVEQTLTPGQYKISMQTDIFVTIEIDLQPDTIVYVSCGVLPLGLVLPAPSLTVVAQSVAVTKMAKTTQEAPHSEE